MSWASVQLSSVADVVRGVTYKKHQAEKAPQPGLLPLLRATNVDDRLDTSDGLLYVPENLVKDRQRLQKGDIVLASSSGSLSVVGKSAILEQDWGGTFGAFCAVIRSSPEVEPRFLSHYLRSHAVRSRWSEAARGTNINNLKRGDLEQTPVPLPPLYEQRRIVDVLEDLLSRLDAASSLLQTAQRRTDALAASTLLELSEGDPVPLGDLAVASGYGSSAKCVVDGPGVPVVRIPNLVAGRIDLDDEKRAADQSTDLGKYMLEPGDLLIVRTNGSVDLIGRSAVAQVGVDAAFASYLIRYRFDETRVRPEWVNAMLQTPRLRSKIERLAASSAGQHNLSLAKLNPLEIPVPALEDQDRALRTFRQRTDELNALRAAVARAHGRSETLRSAILGAAFAGQLTSGSSDLSAAEEMIGA